MSIELREPGQVTRRRFLDLATKAVAALAVAATTGKLLVEEAQEIVGAIRYNVAVRWDMVGWEIGAYHPSSGFVPGPSSAMEATQILPDFVSVFEEATQILPDQNSSSGEGL